MPDVPKRTRIADAFVTKAKAIATPASNFTIKRVEKGVWVFEQISDLPGVEIFLGVTTPDETRQRESAESSTTVTAVGWLNREKGKDLGDELEKLAQDIITAMLTDETLGLEAFGVWDVVVTGIEKDNLLDEDLTGPCACLVEFEVKHENDRTAF